MTGRIKEAAERFPDRTAYRVAGREISYRKLWEASNKYAGCLKEQGKGPVIIYGHKSPGMVTAILACLLAGRPYVPVETYTPDHRTEKIIEVSGADLLI